MNDAVRNTLASSRRSVETLGALPLFFVHVARHLPSALLRPRLVAQQVTYLGALSLVLIMFGGLFVGMVLAFQGHQSLARFGAGESVGVVAALALVRELGPVLTALLFAGRASTALAAEVGTMRATDQIAALELMATDPVRRILAPRFAAGILSVPLLAAVFNVLGMFGAYLVAVSALGVDAGVFWSQIRERLDVADDLGGGMLKATIFGVFATLIGLFEGYYSAPTAEGVSRATTRTVVISSVWILLLDFLITAYLTGGT